MIGSFSFAFSLECGSFFRCCDNLKRCFSWLIRSPADVWQCWWVLHLIRNLERRYRTNVPLSVFRVNCEYPLLTKEQMPHWRFKIGASYIFILGYSRTWKEWGRAADIKDNIFQKGVGWRRHQRFLSQWPCLSLGLGRVGIFQSPSSSLTIQTLTITNYDVFTSSEVFHQFCNIFQGN